MLYKRAVKHTYIIGIAVAIMFSSFLVSKAAGAAIQNLKEHFDAPKIVGQARLTMFFWDIYDASLIAPQGKFAMEQPFALELKYLRSFDGKKIASRSVDEMRKLGMDDEVKLAKWYQEMQDIFPNVKKGEMITGVVDKNQISHFYFNDKLLGKVHDKEFSRWFFSIWLSEQTSEPEMREQLLGLTK